MEKVLDSVSKFTRVSGWVENGVLAVEVNWLKYRPLAGTSYISTPKKLSIKNALVNVQNLYDDKCSLWSIVPGLHPYRVSHYRQYENELNMDCLLYTSRCV